MEMTSNNVGLYQGAGAGGREMTGNGVVNNTNPWMFISILWLFSLTAF